MLTIGNNFAASTQRLLQQHEKNHDLIQQSTERLSTGKRLNRASDGPAQFIDAEHLRGNLVELLGESRAASGDRLQSRQQESALSQIQSVLNNVRGNLVAAADGFNSPEQSRALQQEIDASLDAIDRVSEGVDGVASSGTLEALRQNGSANVLDGDVAAAVDLVEEKLQSINQSRAAIGAYQRTEAAFERFREDQIIITTEALSQIEDTDYVEESTNLVKGKILSEAAIAALSFTTREQVDQLKQLLSGIDLRSN
ncbi:MAG: flagellin [Bythopirellula sp.]